MDLHRFLEAVGFSCRTEIPPKVAAIIASNLQEHVSILEKNIFSLGSWDQKPNYNEAEQRWVSWCKNEKTIANGK